MIQLNFIYVYSILDCVENPRVEKNKFCIIIDNGYVH